MIGCERQILERFNQRSQAWIGFINLWNRWWLKEGSILTHLFINWWQRLPHKVPSCSPGVIQRFINKAPQWKFLDHWLSSPTSWATAAHTSRETIWWLKVSFQWLNPSVVKSNHWRSAETRYQGSRVAFYAQSLFGRESEGRCRSNIKDIKHPSKVRRTTSTG